MTGIFYDLTQAYMLNHSILLVKLGHYGIRGIVNYSIKSCLTQRIQFVEITHIENNSRKQKACASTSRELKYGVPQ
jgi:hypothetical protein